MNLLYIALQAQGAAQGQPGGGMGFWIMIILMFVVMWLFMIRPQQKKQKEMEKFRSELKKGDKVVTIGGIYGTVTSVRDDQVKIAVGNQKTEMNMARWAIKTVEDAPLENDAEPEI